MEDTLSEPGRIARSGDPARFRAALFAPPAARERLFALIAINVELARIAPTVSEPLLGEIRLQWWAEAAEDLAKGQARGHAALQALAEAPPDARRLSAMIDARRADLSDEPPADDAALDAWLEATGGGLAALLAAETARNADLAAAADAGFAEAAGRLIAAAPRLYAEGAVPLPIDPQDVRAALNQGKTPQSLAKALSSLANRALTRLAAARPRLRGPAATSLLSVHVAERALRAAVRTDYNPLQPGFEASPFREQIGYLWRAALKRI